MRNSQTLTVIKQARMESKRSTSTALGQNEAEGILHLVNRFYEWLWFDYNWPFLKIWADKAILAGEYRYDCPAEIDLERIEQVYTSHGGKWIPVDRGISPMTYNESNVENDERTEPILRWDIREVDGSTPQIVVWPLPSANTTLRIVGRRKFVRLVNQTDVCRLDDILVSMFAGAQLAAGDERKDAQSILEAAKKHYNTLKFGYDKTPNSKFNFRGTPAPVDHSKIEIRVAEAHTNTT